MISLAELHSDTLYRCFENNWDLDNRHLHVSLSSFDHFLRFHPTFAHYIPEKQADKWDYLKRFLENSHRLLAKHHIPMFRNSKDLQNDNCVILSVEGGDIFSHESLLEEQIDFLNYSAIRIFSMIYNHDNILGCGAKTEYDSGLTSLGCDVVRCLENNKIIPDISHASAQSAKDILSVAKGPVFATHSNVYSLLPHERNLTDEALKAIAWSGGLIGVNFYPPFLSKNAADISDIIRHLSYLIDFCGEDHVCFGCDFDGVDTLPRGIKNVGSLNDLYENMLQQNFSESILEKIFYQNISNFMKMYWR